MIPPSALFVRTDVTSWSSLLNAFKAAIDQSPSKSIDIVVMSAGLRGESVLPHIFPTGLADDEDLPEPPTATMDVMLTGTYYTTVLALHYFGKLHKATKHIEVPKANGNDIKEDGTAIQHPGENGISATNNEVKKANADAVKDDETANQQPDETEISGTSINVSIASQDSVKVDESAKHNTVVSKTINGSNPMTLVNNTDAYQLVYIASLSSYRGFASMSTYNAAKYGVRGLWKSIRNAPHGTYPFALRTNLVAPTITRTNMTADYFNAFVAAGGVATEVSDVVDVTMRLICDETVDGRAVCALPDGKSFDLGDDPREGDGGKVVWDVSKKDGLGGRQIKTMTGYYEWLPEEEFEV